MESDFIGTTPGQELPVTSPERGTLCWCPPGSFRMGPERIEVTISRGFWIGKHEVTQLQFEQLMGINPSAFRGDRLPVDSVSKDQATSFCEELTRREREAGRLIGGWEYRLPTEAQWEYACRAGTNTIYSWGDDALQSNAYAWFRNNSGNRTNEIGLKKPNPWGLYDMHGNCLEYCRDAYREELPGGVDPEVREEDLGVRPAESDRPFCVARGGGWFFPEEGLATALRSRLGPDDNGYLLGFRIVLVRTGDDETDHSFVTDNQAAREVRELVLNYHADFAAGRYENTVALMAHSMSVYAPYGLLQGIPKNKNEVFDIYQRLHNQGLRLILTPQNIKVALYGNVALATFLTKGIWWVRPGASKVSRRHTQLWIRVLNQWILHHGHVSDVTEAPHLRSDATNRKRMGYRSGPRSD